jgi:GAG-pre-integrase domain
MDTNDISDEEELKKQKELLRWHNRMGHLSMHRLQEMASKGLLPSKITKCRVPICQSCMYGSLTRQPWRTNAKPSNITDSVTKPGDHISVDQLILPVPGLIGQLKGITTRARYGVATVFVDTFSRYTYVHLQQTTNTAETLEAKKRFESHARTC